MTYSSRLRAEHEQQRIGNWPDGKKKLPGWLIEQIAEEKLLGGYKTRPKRTRKGRIIEPRNPICSICFVAKSNSKSCNC